MTLHALLDQGAAYGAAYAAGFLASGIDLSQRDAAEASTASGCERPWPGIIEAALASEDERVIKLVWSCHEEHQVSAHHRSRLAAASAVS